MCRLSYFLHRPPRFSAARRLRYTMSTSAASKNMQTPLPLHLSRQTKKSPTDLPITSSHLISPNLPSSSPVRPSSSSSASAPTYPYLRTSRPSLPPFLPPAPRAAALPCELACPALSRPVRRRRRRLPFNHSSTILLLPSRLSLFGLVDAPRNYPHGTVLSSGVCLTVPSVCAASVVFIPKAASYSPVAFRLSPRVSRLSRAHCQVSSKFD